MDRRAGRLLTGILAIALAVSTLGFPAMAAPAGTHTCCVRLAATCPMPHMQCCATRAPSRPTQAPPPETRTPATPDLTTILPSTFTAPLTAAITLLAAEGPPRSFGSTPLYLLNSTLLV